MVTSIEHHGPGHTEEKGSRDTYVVQRGDTLAGVALRLGVKVSDLKRANRMYGSKTLIMGQVLKIVAIKPDAEVKSEPAAPAAVSVPPADTAHTANPASGSQGHHAENMATASAPGAVGGGLHVESPPEEVWLERPSPAATAEPAAPSAPPGGKRAAPGGGPEQRDGTSPPPRPPAPMASTTISVPPSLSFERETSDASDLLYSPPSWGAAGAAAGTGEEDDGEAGAAASAKVSTPRRLSDLSASSVSVSVRGMLRYMLSPSPKGVSGDGAEATATAKSIEHSMESPAAAAASSGGGGGVGESENADMATRSASIDGIFAGSEEAWFGSRNQGTGFNVTANSNASVTGGGSGGDGGGDGATARSARDASDVSTKSTAQALLSMVKPSYWRTGGGGDDDDEAQGGGGEEGEAHDDGDGLDVGGGGGGGVGDVDGDDLGGPVMIGHGRECDGGGMRASFEESRSCSSMEDSLPVAEEMAMFGAASGDACGGGDILSAAGVVPLKLPGLVSDGSTIVTHSTLARMESTLPKHHRGYNYYLLYSTFRDGASFIQLYNRIKGEEPTFVVVENMKGEVFGGFSASAWASGSQYYGTGECFLFRIDGKRISNSDDGSASGSDSGADGNSDGKTLLDGDMTMYPWSGMNTYLQYSDGNGIGMGGGGAEGNFGLYVGEDFLSGSTGTCDTFLNPPLCTPEQFEISQVEVWGFTTADTEMGARLERLRKTLRGRTTRPL